MPWVVRDAVRDINRAVGRRWQAIDPLLPEPSALPAGCGEPLVADGGGSRVRGLGVCVHQQIPPESLSQTWGPASRFTLVPRLAGQDVAAATDELLTAWRDHLAGVEASRDADTGSCVVWPSYDVTGVDALLGHGLQPLTVIAARTRPNRPPAPSRPGAGVTIRAAGPGDEDAVLRLELALVRFDMRFGGPVWRPATPALVRADVRDSLRRGTNWTWLARRGGRDIGLLVLQPPGGSGWIAGMTNRAPAAYLQSMYVDEAERGTGVGSAMVRHLHARLDADGVAVTLLHHSQVNPLSGPFWNRMGYRPLWTSWEARPASALRLSARPVRENLTNPSSGCQTRQTAPATARRLAPMVASLVAAIVAALCYGVAAVMQAIAARRASNRTASGTSSGGVDPGLLPRMLRQWRFIASLGLDALGFIAQMVALHRLPLFAVQAMVAANLAVTAVLASMLVKARLSVKEWLSVTGVMAGIGLLGSSAGPEGASGAGTVFKLSLIAATAVLGLVGLAAARMRDPQRTLVLGLVAGFGYGLVGIAARVLDGFAPLTLLTDPAAYGVVIAGIVSFVFYAAALEGGNITVATAAVVLAETLPPAVIGVEFLGDSTRPGLEPAAAAGFVLAVLSAVMLARFGEAGHTTEPSRTKGPSSTTGPSRAEGTGRLTGPARTAGPDPAAISAGPGGGGE